MLAGIAFDIVESPSYAEAVALRAILEHCGIRRIKSNTVMADCAGLVQILLQANDVICWRLKRVIGVLRT